MKDWGVNNIKIEDEQASIRVALEGEELRRRAKLAHENRVKAQALDEERKRVVQGYKTRAAMKVPR
jgi:hypothetical protein